MSEPELQSSLAESVEPAPPGGREGFEILAAECARYRVPLERPVAGSSARPGVTPAPLRSWDVIAVRVETAAGVVGTGFTYELRAGGGAVVAALREDLLPLVLGADCRAPEALWERLYWATYNVGRRGAYIHALSALDVALWDAKARMLGLPLARLLGAEREAVPLYESDCGWLSLPLDELVRANGAAVESGLRAVKILVGLSDPREDARRVAAVRAAIGPEPLLMVDAGQKWSLRSAIDRVRRLEEHDVYWVEEPLSCDDVRGHERLATAVAPRIATGQTLTTRFEVQPFLEHRAVDVVQADVARIGGVTEWLRVAQLAAAAGAEVAPHFLMELHVSLVAACPVGTFVERTPWLSALLEEPPAVRDGELLVPEGLGHGLGVRHDVEGLRVG